MSIARRPRPAARILLLDPIDRVLLFRFTPEKKPAFWCTPGGAVDPGESYEEAAARELREETGLVLPCGSEVARRSIEFVTLEDVPVTADERYYLVRAPDAAIDTRGHTALERAVMREWRWLDRAGLAALRPKPFYPEDLAEMLETVGAW